MATDIKSTAPSAYANNKTIQEDLAKLQREQKEGKINDADVQKLYTDMKALDSTGAIWNTQAANGATYGNIIHDLDVSAQGGDLGKAGQDINALTTQLNETNNNVSATIQSQATATAKIDLNTTAGRKAFATAWGDGTTAFARQLQADNPTEFATLAKALNGQKLDPGSGDATWGGINAGFANVKGQSGEGGQIGIYAGKDGSLIIANNQARTVQGYSAGGARQGTNAYDTNSDKSTAQYISSGGATIFWGANEGNGAWGVREPSKTPATPDQLFPADIIAS